MKCVWCEKEFPPHRVRLTCSDRCMEQYKRARGAGIQLFTPINRKLQYRTLGVLARLDSDCNAIYEAREMLRSEFGCYGLYNREIKEMVRW